MRNTFESMKNTFELKKNLTYFLGKCFPFILSEIHFSEYVKK